MKHISRYSMRQIIRGFELGQICCTEKAPRAILLADVSLKITFFVTGHAALEQ